MWADNETSIDLLGFSVHRDLIVRLVTDARLLPVTVGVFGDWGGGKSSVMRMLQRSLAEDHPDVACLYFNGWMFEGYDDAKAALLSSILMQLGEHERFGPKVRGRVVSLLKRVNYMRAAGLAIRRIAAPAAGLAISAASAMGWIDPHLAATMTAMVPGTAAVLSSSSGADKDSGAAEGTQVEEQQKDDEGINWQELIRQDTSEPGPLDLRSFRRDFERLLADTDVCALVVLIDDLDRCEPGRLIENLEAIKLFLAVPKTAFVIAADERIVRHAVATRFAGPRTGDEDSARKLEDLVTDYVEKLIQVPYHLPRLSPSEIESYISLLFCQLELSAEMFDRVHVHCSQARQSNLYVTYGAGMIREAIEGDLPEALEGHLGWTSTITPTLTEGLKGNPRQVKRFLNALVLRKQLADVAGLDIHDDVLVKLMLLEYSRGQLFEQLYQWQVSANGPIPQIAVLEESAHAKDIAEKPPTEGGEFAAWAERAAQDWLRLEPALADVDLSDYFWVARDKLRSTLSGLSTVSPHVRMLVQELIGGTDGDRPLVAREVAGLDSQERGALLHFLGQQLERRPNDPGGVAGFVALINVGVEGALDAFVATLTPVAPTNIGPDIPFELQAIMGNHPETGEKLVPLLEQWQGSKAGIAVGARNVLASRRQARQPGRA